MSKDNYFILYKLNAQFKYKPETYWTTSREFIADTLLITPKFIQDPLLNSKSNNVFIKTGLIA